MNWFATTAAHFITSPFGASHSEASSDEMPFKKKKTTSRGRKAKKAVALSDDDQSDAGDFAVPVRGPVLPEKFDDDEDDDGGVEHDIDAINGDDADSRVKSENEDDEDDEDEDEDEEEL